MRKFAILLGLIGAVVSAHARPNGLSVEMQVSAEQFLSEEDVPVKITIVNRSGQPVVLGTSTNWITFDVVGDNARVASKIKDMSVMGPFTLLSGQSITKEFNPTPYFDFRRPGRYHLEAIIKIPQWKQEMPCAPVSFTIEKGTPYSDLTDITIGVPLPPGVTNAPPDIHHYSLLKVTFTDQIKLYFRLTDIDGHPLRVFALARIVDFRDPEALTDRANNIHVLAQTGAHAFTYFVLDPNGNLIARQVHEYARTRPMLRLAEDGQVIVLGGQRVLSDIDIPAPAPSASLNQ